MIHFTLSSLKGKVKCRIKMWDVKKRYMFVMHAKLPHIRTAQERYLSDTRQVYRLDPFHLNAFLSLTI